MFLQWTFYVLHSPVATAAAADDDDADDDDDDDAKTKVWLGLL